MSEPPAIRAVAYLRQSEQRPGEDAQSSLSLRSQEDRFRQWCDANNAVPVAVVADHDLRGHDASRPGLQHLLDITERERVDVVWVLSLSRFARDHILQELVWRDLQARGVERLVSEIESGTDDPFVRGIYGLLHAKTRVEMSAHLKGAFARRARDGGFPTGPTPTGYRRPHTITVTRANGTRYDRATGEPVIDEERAPFVRSLFQRAASGESLAAITADLRATGPGARGGTWTATTLRRLLTSPIYAGDIAHNGQVVAHNNAWQIIDRATWDAVQERIASNVVVRNGTREHHPLEGLVRHACGQRMYYQPYTGRSAGHGGEYICRGQWEGSCRGERRIIGAVLLVNATRAALVQDLGARRMPATALRIAQDASGGAKATMTRRALDRRASAARDRWQRAYERFVAGKLTSALMDDEDARLAESLDQVERERAAIPAPPDPGVIERDAATLTTVAASIGAATDAELAQLVRLLGSVTVSSEGVRIAYLDRYAPHIDGATVPVPRWGKGLR